MVTNLAIFFMILSTVVSIVVPIGLIVFFRKEYKASLKYFFVGMLAFFIGTQLLESPINYLILIKSKAASDFFNRTIPFMLYGGLMAGIFEETARLICFKFVLKKDRRLINGVSYGIGHGGIEAILLCGIANINNVVIAILINCGMLNSIFGSSDATQEIYTKMVGTPEYFFALGGIERLFAMCLQVALSILVYKAVVEKKKRFYLYAILIHAAIDFIPALYQKRIVSVWVAEGYVIMFGIISLVYIVYRMKRETKVVL